MSQKLDSLMGKIESICSDAGRKALDIAKKATRDEDGDWSVNNDAIYDVISACLKKIYPLMAEAMREARDSLGADGTGLLKIRGDTYNLYGDTDAAFAVEDKTEDYMMDALRAMYDLFHKWDIDAEFSYDLEYDVGSAFRKWVKRDGAAIAKKYGIRAERIGVTVD